ncbi:ABC transporter permease [Actinoplanes sp. CA-030573]|uniref:ABC transporter permease n=1 Tax=Actinoplanes sp. CA-030573 TaxID=3239898 RepID=UPI003D90ABA5
MTAATLTRTPRSAFPAAIEALKPKAVELMAETGELPSRNRLMKELHIGPDKAKALLAALADTTGDAPHAEAEPLRPIVMIEDEAQNYFDAAPVAAPVEPVDDAEAAPPVVTDSATATDFADLTNVADPAEPLPDVTTPPAEAAPPAAVEQPAPRVKAPVTWPVLILCLPAFVAIWAGWVEMGRLTGFGKVTLLPGITDFQIDTAITLPIGVETYAAYALWVWLSGRVAGDARRFAKWSAIGSLALGGLGQVTYHLMNAAHWDAAPWGVTAVVACIPVAVLGMGAALAHLMHQQH